MKGNSGNILNSKGIMEIGSVSSIWKKAHK